MAGSIPVTPMETMMTKQKKSTFDVRVFERAADRLRDLSARVRSGIDMIADALEAAAEHIRETRNRDGHTAAFVAREQEEHDCVCIHCKDTGVADDGWSEGQTCHCAMGVAREEAEKVGLASAAQREAKIEAARN